VVSVSLAACNARAAGKVKPLLILAVAAAQL